MTGNAPHQCVPFFAKDAIDSLHRQDQPSTNGGQDEHTLATSSTTSSTTGFTTVCIQCLPAVLQTQNMVRAWLNELGFTDKYDFLLYVKRSSGANTAFVNFKTSESCTVCKAMLHNLTIEDGGRVLHVDLSKVQGYQDCMKHFSNIKESKRGKGFVPWTSDTPDQADELNEGRSAVTLLAEKTFSIIEARSTEQPTPPLALLDAGASNESGANSAFQ